MDCACLFPGWLSQLCCPSFSMLLCYSSVLFPVCNDNFSRHVEQNKSQCNEDDFSKYYFYKCGINQWRRSVLGRNGGWAGSWGHCDRLARQTMEWKDASGASQLTVQYMAKIITWWSWRWGLGCDAVSVGKNNSGSSSARRMAAQDTNSVCDPEDGGTTILRNIGNYTPDDTASHTRRLTSTSSYIHCTLQNR